MTTLADEWATHHGAGPHSGILNPAIDWVLRYGLTHSLDDEEAVAEAAWDEAGLEEAEVAAALMIMRDEQPAPRSRTPKRPGSHPKISTDPA